MCASSNAQQRQRQRQLSRAAPMRRRVDDALRVFGAARLISTLDSAATALASPVVAAGRRHATRHRMHACDYEQNKFRTAEKITR